MTMQAMPDDLADWIGVVLVTSDAAAMVEHGAIQSFAAAMEDGNPLYWDEQAAKPITGGVIAPPALLSAWTRPDRWSPAAAPVARPLELHFQLKERLGYPNAIVASASTEYLEPARPGDRICAEQQLAQLGPVVETKLGKGRYWTLLVHYRRDDGELLGTESLTFFGYGKMA